MYLFEHTRSNGGMRVKSLTAARRGQDPTLGAVVGGKIPPARNRNPWRARDVYASLLAALTEILPEVALVVGAEDLHWEGNGGID